MEKFILFKLENICWKAGINLSAAKANIDKIGRTSVKLFPKLKLYKINNIKNPKLIASSKYLGKIYLSK